MIWGEGYLFVATVAGTREAGVRARPVRRTTASLWEQHTAVAWTAARVKLRGHGLLGAREILERPEWSEEIHWQEHHHSGSWGAYQGHHVTNHWTNLRPDLILILRDGCQLPIEVELTRKPDGRLRAALFRHAVWCARGQSGGVIYVCANSHECERVIKHAGDVGLLEDRDAIRIELLETIRQQTANAFERRRDEPLRSGIKPRARSEQEV
jgi:hypothetical protein